MTCETSLSGQDRAGPGARFARKRRSLAALAALAGASLLAGAQGAGAQVRVYDAPGEAYQGTRGAVPPGGGNGGSGNAGGGNPGGVVLKAPPGVSVDRLGQDELMIWGLQQEVKALKALTSQQQAQLDALNGKVAALSSQLATTGTSLANLQTAFAHHYHKFYTRRFSSLSSNGWQVFDLTQHNSGGRTVAVGVQYTCAPGIDKYCSELPEDTTPNSATGGPVQPGQ